MITEVNILSKIDTTPFIFTIEKITVSHMDTNEHTVYTVYKLFKVIRASVVRKPSFMSSKRMSLMKIVVTNRSGVPIYEQIKDQVKAAIFSGELVEDEMLPSIRQLARDLKVSVITTTRAYSDLEQEGFVVNMQGRGCFVLPRNVELARENALHKIEESLSAAITAAKTEGIKRSELIERVNILWEADDD